MDQDLLEKAYQASINIREMGNFCQNTDHPQSNIIRYPNWYTTDDIANIKNLAEELKMI